MKSIIIYLFTLFLFISVLFSCKKEFEMPLSLATNQELVELTSDSGETNVMVYSKGEWKAELERNVDWAVLDNTIGESNNTFKFRYKKNSGGSRTISVKLTAGSFSKNVKFIQAAALNPQLSFIEPEPVIVAKAYPVLLPLNTNLVSNTDLENISVNITYSEESGEEWIKEYQITSEGLMFNVLSNTSSNDRRALIQLVYKDAYDVETTAECILRQSPATPIMTLEEQSGTYMLDEALFKVLYQTNMTFSVKALQAELVYESGLDWIQDIVFDREGLNFKLLKNESGIQRAANIKIKAVAIDGGETQLGVFRVVQTINTYNILSFDDLRNLIPASSGELNITDPYYVLNGIVISDKGNVNTALNPLVLNSQTNIDWTESQKTAYIQSFDAQLGLRIQTATPTDNVFERSNEVRLLLNGMTLVKESNPTRYTLKNVAATQVMSSKPAVIQAKQKNISALTDRDLYTFTTLTNVEFAIKNGAYTNVHDGYTFGGIGRENIAGSSVGRGIDCIPRRIVNSSGETLNVLFNMRLPWRRLKDNDLPKGAGNLSGILVHEKMIRYAKNGDIGKYQIRPLVETDIALSKQESAGLTNTLVEWNWDDNTTEAKATWTPDVINGNNSNATLSHESITTVARRPDFNSPYVYFKDNTTAGTNNPTNQKLDIEGYLANGAIEYRGVYWNYSASKGNGFVIDFSSTNISSRAYLSFTIAGGGQAAGNTNYFPLNWHVEYSINGGSYQKISDSDFIVRPLGWWTTLPIYSMMGLSEQHIVLPSAVANNSRVSLKIVPSSPLGLSATDGFMESYANVSSSVSTYVRLGTVSIKYNK